MNEHRVLAAVAVAPGQIELREFSWPELGPRDMMVQILACGICGSDVHTFWEDAYNAPFPLILGHEFVCRVAEVGIEAAMHHNVQVGDVVTPELVIPCRQCEWCKRGLVNLCAQDAIEGREFGCNIPVNRSPGLWGGFAEYMYVPYDAIVHTHPPGVNVMAAMFTEPMAVTAKAVDMVKRRPLGDSAVIVGAGCIGLLQGIAAKVAGFDPVILLGTRDQRLSLAMEVGCADVVVNVRTENALEAVTDLTDGLGADVVFETAGSIEAQRQCFDYCRKAGTVVLVGLTGKKKVPIDIDSSVVFKELTVQASFLGCPDGYEGAIDIIKSGRFPIEKMATHTFPLKSTSEAMRFSREEHDRVLKAVLTP